MRSRPSWEEIEQVEQHLRSFSDPLEPPEQMMLDRVNAGEWSQFEQRFVEHELLELGLMRGGVPTEEAHRRVLAQQGIEYEKGYEAYLYHPNVINHPLAQDWFNQAARDLSARLAGEQDAE